VGSRAKGASVLNNLRGAWDLLVRRHLSLTLTVAIFFICIFTALATGFWLPTRLAYVIFFGLVLARFWARANIRGLEVWTERPLDRLQESQEFSERITVKNQGWYHKLWLEIEDASDLPGHSARRVISLGPRESQTWKTTTLCRRRGLYSVGPVKLTTGDPFGFFRYSRSFGRPQSILVYPRAVELPNFYVPPANLPGDGRFRRRTHYVTPNASGVRQYAPGDSYNRIHWRSTARTNELMVKLFELDPASDIWILLDMDASVHVGRGDDGTEEYAVQVAASIARFFLVANRSVGFISYGKQLFVQEAERGAQQYTHILEALALSRAEGDVPMGRLIDNESKRFGRHTTVVVITPSTSDDWVGSLQFIAERGVKVACALIEPSTFGAETNSLLVFSELAAADIYTYMLKRSDDLITALAIAGEGSESLSGRSTP
jgi:uncharacterized protein (DUF58 family)